MLCTYIKCYEIFHKAHAYSEINFVNMKFIICILGFFLSWLFL